MVALLRPNNLPDSDSADGLRRGHLQLVVNNDVAVTDHQFDETGGHSALGSQTAWFGFVRSAGSSQLLSIAVAAAVVVFGFLIAIRSIQGSPCLLYTSPSPRDATLSRMPSSA